MVEREPQFESIDTVGTTDQFAGTVGTSAIAVPSVSSTKISEVLVRCPNQSPNTVRLLVSFDGGTTFLELSPGEFIGWSLKDTKTQINIKGSVAGVKYEVVMNREVL